VNSRQREVLAVVAAGFFVVQLDLFIVNVAFPSMRHSLGGVGLAQLSWVQIAFAGSLMAGGVLTFRRYRIVRLLRSVH
jgi:hypothetical protein